MENASIWTGIYRRGKSDWRNQDGIKPNEALITNWCREPKQGEDCVTWRHNWIHSTSCFQAEKCSSVFYFACELLKIDFDDQRMAERDATLFADYNITTGIMSENSSLETGPAVDHTLYEGDFEQGGEVRFEGMGRAEASSNHLT